MREDLDKQLVYDFPLLYSDRHGSSMETCMCWGFPNDGWEPLIRELSEKLEPLIEQFIKDNPDGNCYCNHEKHEHDEEGQCTSWLWMPFKFNVSRWNKGKVNALKTKVNKILNFLFEKFNIGHKVYCKRCKGYIPDYPRAAQVKEKFGGLRFYMTWCTDEMSQLIDEAESKSETICEQCGEPGSIRHGGWVRALCDEHAIDMHGNLLLPLNVTEV